MLCVCKDCEAQLTALEPFLVCSLLLDQYAMGDPTGAQGPRQALGFMGTLKPLHHVNVMVLESHTIKSQQ